MGRSAKRKKRLKSSKSDLEKMTQDIKSITNKITAKKAFAWTEEQVEEIEYTKNLYGFALTRVRYLIFKNAGYSFEDPVDNLPLVGHKKQIETISNLLFCQLNLISKAWDIVRQAAVLERREFNYNHPIELFFEMCNQMASADLSDPLSRDIDRGDSLTSSREYFRTEAKFYRDRLESEQTKSILNEYKQSKYWWQFFLHSMWAYRYNPDIENTWKEFLKAHKQWVSFNCNKESIENARLLAFKWNHGRPVNPKTGQPIKFKEKY